VSCLSDRATLLRRYLSRYLFIVLRIQGKFAIAYVMEDRRIATAFLMSGSKDYLISAVSIVQNLNCSLPSKQHFLKEREFGPSVF
jgi:hypothetical protein